jgi:hypothetical protein
MSVSVALVIQHAKRMRHIILSFVVSLAVRNVFILSPKQHDFWEKLVKTQNMFSLSLRISREKFLILRRIQQDMLITVDRSWCKVPVILVRLQWSFNFSLQVFEESSNIKFNQNPSSWSRVVTCGQTDGLTDMTKLMTTFRNFVNAPKNYSKVKLKIWSAFYCITSLRKTSVLKENASQQQPSKSGYKERCQVILLHKLVVSNGVITRVTSHKY